MNGLDAYSEVLSRLKQGRPGKGLPFLDALPGIEKLFQTMACVAPARPGAPDEEWNPLSQRPHTPLPPEVDGELGSEITQLKEAVDAFTTLCHEMLHVVLWEPFFAGRWRPKTLGEFREFALRGEGYCFFFSDIILTGAVRVRLPDGEFALDRQTPSSAQFPPVRAFAALGIKDPDEILTIYLEAFNGHQTKLWQPKGKSDFAAALAARTYEFYAQSVGYLDEFHAALSAFGTFSEFHDRFCAIKGLPTLGDLVPQKDSTGYFEAFHAQGLKGLAKLSPAETDRVRWRRSLQMRAYFVLQVRWLIAEDLVFGKASAPAAVRQGIDDYLSGIEGLLEAPVSSRKLEVLDAAYDSRVRKTLLRLDLWVGERFLILPRRAGGKISLFETTENSRTGKARRLVTIAYLVDELTRLMKASRTIEDRTTLLAEIQHVAGFGAKSGSLTNMLKRPLVRETWSLPLAAVDPVRNLYRELVFSYQ